MLIAICTLSLAFHASTPISTDTGLAYPVGEAEPGTIAVRVLDRNHLPLGAATIRGVFESAGAAQLLFDDNGGSAALIPLEAATTGKDGRALLVAPEGGWCGVSVERSGFAAGRFLPLFEGYAYELVLDFGASITLVCLREDGSAVDAELVIEHRAFPALPFGATPVRRLVTGPDGICQVDCLPLGPTTIFARGKDGARGQAYLSVGSAWRSNALFPDNVRILTLHPTQERLIPVTDREGNAVHGLRAIVTGDLPEGWASVAVEEGGLRVGGVLDPPLDYVERLQRAVDVRVFADGWRAVQFSVFGGEPPTVLTEPMKLVRDVPVPPSPISGRLWTKVDPYGFSHWQSDVLAQGAECKLDTGDGFSLAGALVDDGQVAAWLRTEETPEGVQLGWLDSGSIRAQLSVDGEPYRLGLVRFELVEPTHNAALPHGLSRPMWTFADPNGACELRGLLPGKWRVSLSTSYLNSEGSVAFAEVGPREERQLELDATRGMDVRGVVVDDRGMALSGGLVSVIGLDRRTVLDGTFPVATDGTFLITGLIPWAGYRIVWEEDPPPRSSLPQRFLERVGLGPHRTADVVVTGDIPDSITIVVPTN